MGSESVSTLILLIASLIVAGIVATSMIQAFAGFTDAVEQRADRTTNRINTDIEIINDPNTNGTYNESTNTLTVYVKNTGDEELENTTEQVDLFVNGTYTNIDQMKVHDSQSWRPGTVAELTVNIQLASGYNRVKVAVKGQSDTLEFYI